jgi:hypothetical protein
MNPNDKTPAHGVPSTTTDTPSDRVAETELTVAPEDLALFDAYHHELGLLAAETARPSTPEEQAEVDALYAETLETMSKSPDQVRAERRRRRE